MLKLIIADDEMDARDNMIACINWEQHGLEIAGTAGDGLTAYSLIMERNPDIVLIDIKMPGLSGLEVIQKVRKQTRHSPAFVIVSGYDDFHYAQQAIDLGVSSYLLKPFSPNDLLRAMRRASRQTSTAGDISDRPLAHLLLDAFHHTPNTGCLFYPDKQEREIIACLSTGDISQLYRLLDQFLETVRTSNDSLSQVFDCFLIFYAGICRVLAQRGCSLSEDHFSQAALGGACDAYETIQRSMRSLCTEASRLLSGGGSSNYIIRRTLACIETDYAKKLSLNILAEQIYVSPVYLSNLFKKTMGQTITEYIQAVRIDRARELLHNSSLAIGDVAEQVGYTDIKYFAQVFKKATGVTPNAFRNQLQKP